MRLSQEPASCSLKRVPTSKTGIGGEQAGIDADGRSLQSPWGAKSLRRHSFSDILMMCAVAHEDP
eukprot:m.34564 g.34564  ORF g.34564 m.34564 type:complete len:65 (-) comp7330_c0_seq1:66-260(-)